MAEAAGVTLPTQTLYVGNLNESVNKTELRRALYSYFSQFGPILDVVALKTAKMRGQAFIVFRDLKAATAAARTVPGFIFYGRPLRVSFSKTKSYSAMKEDGTFARYQAEQRLKAKGVEPNFKKPRTAKNPADAAAAAAATAAATAAAAAAASAAAAAAPVAPEIPHTILYLENLPKETTSSMISMLFSQLAGFKEVRLVQGRPDIAFVEYNSIETATEARNALQSFRITPVNILKISFAKQ